MKMHRFYFPSPLPESGAYMIRDTHVAHQLQNVLRKKTGDRVLFFTGDGREYVARLEVVKKDAVSFVIERTLLNTISSKCPLTLFQSIIKNDKLDWVIQKGTELGFSKFVPIISERSEKKGVNETRMQHIAREATEQSGRARVPEITPPISLEEALRTVNGTVIAFHVSGVFMESLKLEKGRPLSIFVGPEGGWSDLELDTFTARKIPLVSLGGATLRSETATIAALALLLL